MEYRQEKIVGTLTTTNTDEPNIPQRFFSWRRLIRVTALINLLARRIRARRNGEQMQDGPLTPTELQEEETLWLKEAQTSLHSRMHEKEFDALSPFLDDKGVTRVGGTVDNAVVTYESRHPALLPYEHRISLLITRHMHQCGHSGVASTTAKIRARYWILKASKLTKSVKFKCSLRREMARRAETQQMADLPSLRLAPFTPPFHYTACDHFGPFKVKVGRNKTAKHYGVMSDNGSQMVGAARELREIVQGLDNYQLPEFCAEKEVQVPAFCRKRNSLPLNRRIRTDILKHSST